MPGLFGKKKKPAKKKGKKGKKETSPKAKAKAKGKHKKPKKAASFSLFGSKKKAKKKGKKKGKKEALEAALEAVEEPLDAVEEPLPDFIEFEINVSADGPLGMSINVPTADDIDDEPMNSRVLVTFLKPDGGLRTADEEKHLPEYDKATSLPIDGSNPDELFAVDGVEMRGLKKDVVLASLGARPLVLKFRRELDQPEVVLTDPDNPDGEDGDDGGDDFLKALGLEPETAEELAEDAATDAEDAADAAAAAATAADAAAKAAEAATAVAEPVAVPTDVACTLVAEAAAGDYKFSVSHVHGFDVGADFAVNKEQPSEERGTVVFVDAGGEGKPSVLVLRDPLKYVHRVGEHVVIHSDGPLVTPDEPVAGEDPVVLKKHQAEAKVVMALVLQGLEAPGVDDDLVQNFASMFEKGAMPAAQAEKMLQLLLTKAAAKAEEDAALALAASLISPAKERYVEQERWSPHHDGSYVTPAHKFDFRQRMVAGDIRNSPAMQRAGEFRLRTAVGNAALPTARLGEFASAGSYGAASASSAIVGAAAAQRRARGHLGIVCDVLAAFFASRPSEPDVDLRRQQFTRRGGGGGGGMGTAATAAGGGTAYARAKTPFGLVVGSAKLESEGGRVTRILLTNHVTSHVLAEAKYRSEYEPGYQLVLSRTSPLRGSSVIGVDSALALRCAQDGIAVFAIGDALDHINGGVNDWLCASIGDGSEAPLLASEADRASIEPRGRGRLLTLERPTNLNEILQRLRKPGGLRRIQLAPSGEHYAMKDATLNGGEILDAADRRAKGSRVRTIAIASGCTADELASFTAWSDVDVLIASGLPLTSVLSFTERDVNVVLVGSCIGMELMQFLRGQLSEVLDAKVPGVRLDVSSCTTAMSPFLVVA